MPLLEHQSAAMKNSTFFTDLLTGRRERELEEGNEDKRCHNMHILSSTQRSSPLIFFLLLPISVPPLPFFFSIGYQNGPASVGMTIPPRLNITDANATFEGKPEEYMLFVFPSVGTEKSFFFFLSLFAFFL